MMPSSRYCPTTIVIPDVAERRSGIHTLIEAMDPGSAAGMTGTKVCGRDDRNKSVRP